MGDGVPSDPHQQLLLLAIQERLQSQLRSSTTNDSSRLLQQMLLGLNPLLSSPLDLAVPSSIPSHPLWQHQLCAWPGCDQPAETITSFLNHINTAHPLDERAALQMRQQIELVDSLDHRLGKERGRLQAMMQHLHMKHSPDTTTPTLGKTENESVLSTFTSIAATSSEEKPMATTTVASGLKKDEIIREGEAGTSGTVTQSPSTVNTSSCRRSRVSDKAILPISTDIARNRDFYRSNDVRPPYTYASLIRQAIMESPECQLTLNEIYNWFTDTFMYFRRNAATWKNAVRHNLSLHKCFARVEQNVKGAVWTVDDSEFYKRRSQRVNPSRSNASTPSLSDSATIARRLLESRLNVVKSEASSLLDPSLSFSSLLTDNPLSLLAAASAVSQMNSGAPLSSYSDGLHTTETSTLKEEDPHDDLHFANS